MLHVDSISALADYKERYPTEDIEALIAFVTSNPASVQRSNQQGHVTASGLVLKDDALLLIFHNKLQRFLQPGGHLEETDTSLYEAARREIHEETGLDVAPSPLFPDKGPLHIDAHVIPARPRHNEPEHWHYDCLYLFTPRSGNVRIDMNEVGHYQWVPLEFSFTDKALRSAATKIKRLMSNSARGE